MSPHTLPLANPWVLFTPPSAHWSHYLHTFRWKGVTLPTQRTLCVSSIFFRWTFFLLPATCSPHPKGLPLCSLLGKHHPSLKPQLLTSLFPLVLEAWMEGLNQPRKLHCHSSSCLDRVLREPQELLGTGGRQRHRSSSPEQDCFKRFHTLRFNGGLSHFGILKDRLSSLCMAFLHRSALMP